ncbi:hypothetical protein OS493_039907 [Desmophyllum pertusum]|uniref:Metalloendopeptidase n=1 Tax=Desmophyllum pertusum TaxID=174260 RepID=A0A9X0CU41_9CNID|nr:hypothetical protein OS493_039907 [Desmophyllum pertusum]
MICWNGGQHLNLAKGCWGKGVVIHEIAHAIGFLHEQDRPDRDKLETRVRSAQGCLAEYDTSGTPYDYLSIMPL